MQTRLSGDFVLTSLPGAAWRLHNRLPPGECVVLRGVPSAVSPLPAGATGLAVEWAPAGDARVTLSLGSETLAFEVASAVLHEPLPELYEPLGLPRFTPDTARFWRRVFRVVRLPGGRWLLGWLARRARRAASN